MTSAALIALALTCGADNTEARLIDAIAMRESTRAIRGIHMSGDNGKAWGIYQFHKARWKELGGDPKTYGKANATEQTKVMLKVIRRCKANAAKAGVKLTDEQLVIWVSRYHNIGNCGKSKMNQHTEYSRYVWKIFKSN